MTISNETYKAHDIYLDYVFLDPDNTLRNIVMLLDIDEPKLRNIK